MTTKEKEAKRAALLAKALGKDVKDVQVISEPKEATKPAKKSAKTTDAEPSMEDILAIKLPPRKETELENDDAEPIEIVETKPVKGKKVIAQNSAQAKKILSKKEKEAANQKALEESIAADQARTAAKEKAAKTKAKKEAAKAPANKPFSEMTPEEQTARRKEISAKALAARRAKKEARELEEARASQEEQENAEPKNKFDLMCPHSKHGLEFGTDAEEYDVCDNCPLLKECIAKRDEPVKIIPVKKEKEVIPVKRVRKNAPKETADVPVNPLADKVIPEGMTGAELKRTKKAEKKAAKAAAKVAKTSSRTRTNKPADAPKRTRSEMIGIVLKDDPELSADDVIELADEMFTELTGVESNIAQTKKYYTFAINFLKGYNA